MKSFSERVIAWQLKHGRHHLPWQQNKTPYRVWLSEIMLQQTQVTTVIPYFVAYTKAFPTVIDLANADEEQVLQLWAGLGYYNRARNLHKCAKIIRDDFGGEFPQSVEALESLPGIGRSTAGAIASLSMRLYAPILDGNVKRVLSRYFAIDSWYGNTQTLKQLWSHAETLTPTEQCDTYNQAMMDLGSMICTRSKPDCEQCPVNKECIAYKNELTDQLPVSKPKKKVPTKYGYGLLIFDEQDRLLMQKRPPTGIWPSLWSLPEIDNTHHERKIEKELPKAQQWLKQHLNIETNGLASSINIMHKFSHYQLNMQTIKAVIKTQESRIMEPNYSWFTLEQAQQLGIPAPIKKCIKQISKGCNNGANG